MKKDDEIAVMMMPITFVAHVLSFYVADE